MYAPGDNPSQFQPSTTSGSFSESIGSKGLAVKQFQTLCDREGDALVNKSEREGECAGRRRAGGKRRIDAESRFLSSFYDRNVAADVRACVRPRLL